MIKTISVNRQARFIKPRIKELEILINDQTIGILEKNSVFRFKYISEKAPLLGLHYSDRAKIYQSLNLPYIFAQYFPEGFWKPILIANIHSQMLLSKMMRCCVLQFLGEKR